MIIHVVTIIFSFTSLTPADLRIFSAFTNCVTVPVAFFIDTQFIVVKRKPGTTLGDRNASLKGAR